MCIHFYGGVLKIHFSGDKLFDWKLKRALQMNIYRLIYENGKMLWWIFTFILIYNNVVSFAPTFAQFHLSLINDDINVSK